MLAERWSRPACKRYGLEGQVHGDRARAQALDQVLLQPSVP